MLNLARPIVFKPKVGRKLAAKWDPRGTKISRLQVILKTVERCNINCSYCYYFNGGDQKFRDRPPTILPYLHSRLAEFLIEGAAQFDIDTVHLVFHGGEPMMQKKSDFDKICTSLRESFANISTKLELSIQTNGTLIDNEWLALLDRHRVSIGISLDGPREYNDEFRVDHKGRSTYEKTADGIRAVHRYQREHKIDFGLGALTVINKEFDYKRVFEHLHRDLFIDRTGFLLPDGSYDNMEIDSKTSEQYGKVLCDIFDAWVNSPEMDVAQINKVLNFFQQKRIIQKDINFGNFHSSVDNLIIVIHSDGSLDIDDSLIPASNWRNNVELGSINGSLIVWLSNLAFEEFFAAQRNLPDACNGCGWSNLCRGGDVENRYSSKNGFNNASIYCESLKVFYGHILNYLCSHGYPFEAALDLLKPSNENC